LARYLVHQGKFDEAIEHYEAALRADPDNIAAVNNYAILLATCADEHFRNYARAVELAERGWRITKGTDPDLRYTLALASMQQAGQSAASGRTAEAMRRYARAIEAVPDCHEAMANLAFLLATCAEETLRDPARAVTLAQRSCALAGKPDAYHLSILAAACAAAGRFDDAVAAISAAIQSAQQSGDPRLAAELQRQSDLYRKRMPYRAPR
jgi:tetratricopeptide (TPR) repeat protein